MSRRRRSDRARRGSPPARSSCPSPTVSGFGGFLSNRHAPGGATTRTCPETCPELGDSDLRQLETDALNCAYLRHLARKWATFNPKVVGSNPTGGIEKQPAGSGDIPQVVFGPSAAGPRPAPSRSGPRRRSSGRRSRGARRGTLLARRCLTCAEPNWCDRASCFDEPSTCRNRSSGWQDRLRVAGIAKRGGVRLSRRDQPELRGEDLEREVFREDAALREAAGGEPEARLRCARPHVA